VTDGDGMVGVAFVPDRPQAEMIQGLLESRGIPCFPQQTSIDGPMMGVGLLPHVPHQVMVHADRADAARAILADADHGSNDEGWGLAEPDLEPASGWRPRDYGLLGAYGRAIVLSVGAMGLAFGVFLLLRLV
jgi:hypothetical protein